MEITEMKQIAKKAVKQERRRASRQLILGYVLTIAAVVADSKLEKSAKYGTGYRNIKNEADKNISAFVRKFI